MKVIFLDIDGVLNNWFTREKSPAGFIGINRILLERFAECVKSINATIILSSCWQNGWNKNSTCNRDATYLNEQLASVGLEIFDKTGDSEADDRGVIQYITSHPDIEKFVIIDDSDYPGFYNERLKPFFIRTDGDDGITEEDCNRIKELLK